MDVTRNRLGLTSLESLARVEEIVNRVYRKVTSSIGLITSRRQTQTLTVDTAVVEELPDITISGFEKILKIFLVPDPSSIRLVRLGELLYDELTDLTPRVGSPRYFANKLIGASYVTFTLDAVPESGTFTLRVDGYDHLLDLEEDAEPFLPEDFHDILVEGAMSEELRRMEKAALAGIAETTYQQRLSDLKMFLAKSGYLDIIPNKSSRSTRRSALNPWWIELQQ